MAPIGDIDYIIMTNANEEAFLWELLDDYRKDYPGLSAPEALSKLKARLAELVLEGKVGIYNAEAGRSYESADEYKDLKRPEALAAISDDSNWGVPTNDTETLNYLWARDESYFGKYYGSTKDES